MEKKDKEVKEKKPKGTIYKSLYPGRTTYRYVDKNEKNRQINFPKGQVNLTDPEDIAFVEDLRKKQLESGKLEILTVSEYEAKVTPDKTHIEFDDGKRVHKKVMIDAYNFALEHGFKPNAPTIVEPSPTIGKGLTSGKTATEGKK